VFSPDLSKQGQQTNAQPSKAQSPEYRATAKAPGLLDESLKRLSGARERPGPFRMRATRPRTMTKRREQIFERPKSVSLFISSGPRIAG
jgi:hypothetical protein